MVGDDRQYIGQCQRACGECVPDEELHPEWSGVCVGGWVEGCGCGWVEACGWGRGGLGVGGFACMQVGCALHRAAAWSELARAAISMWAGPACWPQVLSHPPVPWPQATSALIAILSRCRCLTEADADYIAGVSNDLLAVLHSRACAAGPPCASAAGAGSEHLLAMAGGKKGPGGKSLGGFISGPVGGGDQAGEAAVDPQR